MRRLLRGRWGVLAIAVVGLSSGCDEHATRPHAATDAGPPDAGEPLPSFPGGRGDPCGDGRACEDGLLCCSLPSYRHRVCIGVQDDPGSCGACGRACPQGAQCILGVCVPGECDLLEGDVLCGSVEACCLEAAEGGEAAVCRNLALDETNCGACGASCTGFELCDNGACRCPRSSGGEVCGGSCVNVYEDSRHCGACDRPCPADLRICSRGACTTCEALGLLDCGEEGCTYPVWDDLHCGACGNSCGPNAQCIDGACVTGDCDEPCPSGRPVCCSSNGVPVCTNLFRDDRGNCGACGRACGQGESCAPPALCAPPD